VIVSRGVSDCVTRSLQKQAKQAAAVSQEHAACLKELEATIRQSSQHQKQKMQDDPAQVHIVMKTKYKICVNNHTKYLYHHAQS